MQNITIRAVMLTTALQPYTGIADLFVIDPDGFIIRKWNSKELNNGVLTGRFQLPEYPKGQFTYDVRTKWDRGCWRPSKEP